MNDVAIDFVTKCNGPITKLLLSGLSFNDEKLLACRPMLQHVEVLKLLSCSMSQTFCDELPSMIPNIRQIDFENYKHFTPDIDLRCKHAQFENLTKVSFSHVRVLNPQLRGLSICRCFFIARETLKHLAKHASSNLEKLALNSLTCSRKNAKYFRRLKKLNSLELRVMPVRHGKVWINPNRNYLTAILWRLRAAAISLEHLILNCFRCSVKLIGEISKFKKLKTLHLGKCCDMPPLTHLVKSLTELRELVIDADPPPDRDTISTIISNAEKLNILVIGGCERIIMEIYEATIAEWINIVENHSDTTHTTHLEVYLSNRAYECFFHLPLHHLLTVHVRYFEYFTSTVPGTESKWENF